VLTSERRKSAGFFQGLKFLSSLEHPSYRIFTAGSIWQFAASNVQAVTNSFLIYHLTGSKQLLGIMALFCAIPPLFVVLFGGVIADRVKKKYILVAGNGALALVALGIALSLHTQQISQASPGSYWILIIAAMLQSIISAFSMTALMSIVPETVRPDQLMNAVALSNLVFNAAILLVSGLAGVAIDRLGFIAAYLITTGLYTLSVLFYLFIPNTHKYVTTGRVLILNNISAVFQYIRRNSRILYVLIFMTILVMLSTPYQQFLPVYAVDILKRGATGQGLLLSMAGAGALLGSFIIVALPARKRGLMLLCSGIVAGAVLLVFSFSSIWGLSLTMMIFIGLTNSVRNTIGSVLLQSNTEPAFMGRVTSFIYMQFNLASVFTFLAGVLMQVIMVQWVLGGLAISLIVITGFMMVFNRTLRRLD
jgi:MFS family permease